MPKLSFYSREFENVSLTAEAYAARVACRGRTVEVEGKASSRLMQIAKSIGWTPLGPDRFEIPNFKPSDERGRILQPHFLSFAAQVQKALLPHERLFFVTGFDLIRQWEELPVRTSFASEPDAIFYLLDEFQPFKAEPVVRKPLPATTGEFHLDSDLSRVDFKSRVEKARKLFARGELMEVVLSRELSTPFSGSAEDFFKAYRSFCPSPYEFLLNDSDFSLVGCSPETMVRVSDREVLLRPISGTVRSEEDIPYLLSSPKEKAELDMLIDLGRNDVSRVCESGVRVEDYRSLLRLSNVIHTYASIRGRLRPEFEPFHALASTLNAGTLTGAPKVAAMELISNLEPTSRGLYGGAVGVALPDGTIDSAITIRSAVIREGKIKMRVGATLLHASDPELEYQETEHKARALAATCQAFQEKKV